MASTSKAPPRMSIMLAIMAEDTLLAPIFNTRYCLASESPPTLAPSSIGGIVAAMKHVLLALVALVVAAGCGKKDVDKPKADPTKNERLLWEFETGDSIGGVASSPAIGSDGTVYVGSVDKKLYAIKTGSKGPAKSPWPMRGQNARHTGRVMKK